jgi:hypothetical protein
MSSGGKAKAQWSRNRLLELIFASDPGASVSGPSNYCDFFSYLLVMDFLKEKEYSLLGMKLS